MEMLDGQDTLLSCWRALAETEFGPGRLANTSHAIAAVFPDSTYFNNAILTSGADSAQTAAESLAELYADAGITSWALWVPNGAATFDRAPDRLGAIDTLTRDVTTVAMTRELGPGPSLDDRVRTVSGSALRRLTLDEVVPVAELGQPDEGAHVIGWALIEDGCAVASAYTHRNGTDCGIYAVGTQPAHRRRGLASALVEHILAQARDSGIRSASLQSTPMGSSVYERLGFRPVGRYEEWLHSPDGS